MTEVESGIPFTQEEVAMLPLLKATLERADQIAKELGSFGVKAGSELMADDLASPRTFLSQHAISYLGYAADCLLGVNLMVFEGGGIPAYATIPLTRNAFEAIGVTLWILGPVTRDARVTNALKTEYESHTDQLKLQAEYVGSAYEEPATDDAFVMRLNEIKNARKPLRQVNLAKIPSLTQRMKSAEQHAKPEHDNEKVTLSLLWNLTSGVTHGRRDALYNFMEKGVVAETENSFTAEMSTPVTLLYPLCKFALNYLESALALLHERNNKPE